MTGTRRLGTIGAAVALAVVSCLGPAAPSAATDASAAHTGATCASPGGPFRPTGLAIRHVLPSAEVLGRGRDENGVPKPPPLTERGRWQLAWDRASGVRPGDAVGVVRLTAHTYPARQAGRHFASRVRPPALGNLLVARLHPGALLRVAGPGDAQLCYRVTRRQRVRASQSLSGYYDTAGAPRLAILVCSGKRRGPGDWTHRTIWWARPT